METAFPFLSLLGKCESHLRLNGRRMYNTAPLLFLSKTMGSISESKLIIVRHAERIDEVSMSLWREVSQRHREAHMTRERCRNSESNDPHLTELGLQQAEEAAMHLIDVLNTNGIQLQCIYSSRLIRAVQTAHKIAVKLDIPIVVSSSLAESAAAVAQSEGRFDFLSTAELAHFAPGVTLVDGDEPTTCHGSSSDDEEVGDFLTEDEPMSARNIAMGNWEKCIHSVARKHEIAVVVAHRETIRDLAPEFQRRRVPYCGLAYFDCKHVSRPELKLHSCSDRDGSLVFPPVVEGAVLRSFWTLPTDYS